MDLSELAGNPRVKELLAHRTQGRGLSHAYILAGPPGSGRHTLAGLLSRALVCTAEGEKRPCGVCTQCRKAAEHIHPDVITITGAAEGKPITVDQVRSLRADAHIRPNEAARKVYILEEADRMNDSAQNAMLKLLEEGPAYAAFLLVAENAGGLLQTVRSRCEVLELTPVPLGDCEGWLRGRFPREAPDRLRQAALDCQGILGRAVEELEGGSEAGEDRRKQAAALADALEKGGELQLFEASMLLEQAGKNQLIPLLEALEGELVGRMRNAADRRRLMKAVDLVRQLRGAAQVNANAGQLAGWLCAGMFVNTGTRNG